MLANRILQIIGAHKAASAQYPEVLPAAGVPQADAGTVPAPVDPPVDPAKDRRKKLMTLLLPTLLGGAAGAATGLPGTAQITSGPLGGEQATQTAATQGNAGASVRNALLGSLIGLAGGGVANSLRR